MKEETIWSVREVNRAVKEIIENSLMPFWLQGEISNLTLHRSGHAYLTLKDEKCQLRAVFFNGAAAFSQAGLQSGSLIETYGRLTVYENRGEYQFSITKIRPAGLGDIQRKFEELKKKLAAEGLFDSAKKRPIPSLPRRIGVITSPTGAAMRDFLQIIDRRFPDANIRIYPSLVQGESAAASVVRGLEFFNRTGAADVIIITRGGGSMEDLWPFNEEKLVRAVAASQIPVVSAVGHEIDFTLCDFAADLRVPTPSAAAELVIGEYRQLAQRLTENMAKAINLVNLQLLSKRQLLSRAEKSLNLENLRYQWQNRSLKIDELDNRLAFHLGHYKLEKNSLVENLAARLSAFELEKQLMRGFSIISDADGHIVKTSKQAPGTRLHARLADGSMDVEVAGN